MSAILGGKARQAIAAPILSHEPPQERGEHCERTGWTDDSVAPRWVADALWGLGWLMRKAWLYACAPVGFLFWLVFAFIVLPRA